MLAQCNEPMAAPPRSEQPGLRRCDGRADPRGWHGRPIVPPGKPRPRGTQIDPAFAGVVLPEVHQDIDQGIPDLPRRRECPRVVPVRPDASAAAGGTVDGPREPQVRQSRKAAERGVDRVCPVVPRQGLDAAPPLGARPASGRHPDASHPGCGGGPAATDGGLAWWRLERSSLIGLCSHGDPAGFPDRHAQDGRAPRPPRRTWVRRSADEGGALHRARRWRPC